MVLCSLLMYNNLSIFNVFQPYVPLYLAGTEAYFSENYASAVSNLEESLLEFLNAIERCRADCEGPFDQGWLPDFTPSITSTYILYFSYFPFLFFLTC